MWHDVLDCSLQFLTAFFKTLYAVGEEEPNEELRKRLSAFDSYFKQNDKYLGGEPILLLRQRKEKARKSKSFFEVEHLKVLFFIQTKLLLPNFEARTISDKKNHTTPRLSPITYSLSPNFSWPFFHFFWCAFTVRRPSRKVHAIHEDGWSPHENLYSFLAPSIMKPLKAAQVYRCYSWTLKLVEYAQLRGNCALKYKDKPGVNFPPPSPLPWFRLAFSPPILGLCLILKMLYFLQKVINPEWEIS